VRPNRCPAALLAAAFAGAALAVPVPDTAPKPPVSGLFRGGIERTGYDATARLPARPAVLWSAPLPGSACDPVFDRDTLFVGDDQGGVSAIDAGSGKLRWRNGENRGQVFRAVAVAGERVFVTSSERGLEALNRADGSVLWHYPITGGANGSSPLPAGPAVLVGGGDGFAHAVDAATGREGWRHDIVTGKPADPPGFDGKKGRGNDHPARPSSPAGDGRTLFLPVFDQSRVIALDLKTGAERWSYQTKGWIFGVPAVHRGRVLIGSQDRGLHCLDAATGKPHWVCPGRARIECGVAVAGDAVYVASCDGRLRRVEFATGKEVWANETPSQSPLYSAPLLTPDGLVFGSFDGHLYALKPDSGALLWKFRPPAATQIASTVCTDGRRLFVTVQANNAYSLVAVGDVPAR
jgi:glucose dehydrogenase